MTKTYVALNKDTGILHAYSKVNSHYERKCNKFNKGGVLIESKVTESSISWFLNQPSRCKSCSATFDSISPHPNPNKVKQLQQIARSIEG